MLGLEQVLDEEGVPVQISHKMDSKNASFYLYWTAKEEALTKPEVEVKVYQEAIKDDLIEDDDCNVPTITIKAEPFTTEKRAPIQDNLTSLIKQVQEHVKLSPSSNENIISVIEQYEHAFATPAQDLQGGCMIDQFRISSCSHKDSFPQERCTGRPKLATSSSKNK